MYRLSQIILILFGFFQSFGQSPHGDLFKTDCAACHDPNGWLPLIDSIQFDHSLTNFPLEGTHLMVECKDCHRSPVFSDAASQCVSCHTDIHSMSVGNDCARCHTPQNWLVDYIPELHLENGFPLVGVHSTPNCVDCHLSENNLRFDRIGNDCINCHREQYLATQSPNHQKVGFSTNCTECHDSFGLGWNTDILNHDFFPLVQGHAIQDCKQCHLTDNYADASPDCASCHLKDYTATTNPNHTSSRFSTNCADCHNIGAWIPSDFDHDAFYPLVGAHAIIATNCAECHVDGNFTSTPNTCVGCHQTAYNATTNPNHSVSQFPTDCIQCHNEGAWVPANFDHDIFYPLIGTHSTIANNCTECHINNIYTNTPNTCVGCHQSDYNTAANPNHSAAQFSTDCATCHSETAWSPSNFDHGTFYPLVGAHATVATNCIQCHNNNNYTSTPNTCVGCHLNDYNNVTNPNHSTAKFPTDCTECHNETVWIPSDFDHDGMYFPIYSGKHQGVWSSSCTECHTNSSNYAVFSCINCHEHSNKTKVDNDHKGESGYTYTSSACYSCHPNGRN